MLDFNHLQAGAGAGTSSCFMVNCDLRINFRIPVLTIFTILTTSS